jgi:hypothetical protein
MPTRGRQSSNQAEHYTQSGKIVMCINNLGSGEGSRWFLNNTAPLSLFFLCYLNLSHDPKYLYSQ